MAAQIRRAGDASPRYSFLQDDPFSSVHRLSTSSSNPDARSIMTAPPPYDASSKPFLPTIQLQIETPGKPLLSLPLPPKPDPIPIFTIPTSTTFPSSSTLTPTYLSLRPTRSSGSCFLISPSPSPSPEYSPLSTTTYRFGPSRPPLISLYLPSSHPPTTNPLLPPSPTDQEGTDLSLTPYDSFHLTSPSLLSRTVEFRSRFGTFQWRYASRPERQNLSPTPNNLLLLEKITRIANAHSSKPTEVRTLVARFIRSEECRSVGSSASSAGNGGRVEVDLGEWEDEKTEREMMVVVVVTTALSMLKKEVDRRRAQQFVVMTGAAGS